MKKKLLFLSSLTSVVFASLSPIACNNKKKDEETPTVNKPNQEPVTPPSDDNHEEVSYKLQRHMLYHYAVVTNLGYLENDNDETIINAFLQKNNLPRSFKRDLSIGEKNTTNRYAIINAELSKFFFESTVRITFSTITPTSSPSLSDLIKNTNVIANRHVIYGDDIPSDAEGVQNVDIMNAINEANGLNLNISDYEIKILSTTEDASKSSDKPLTASITDRTNSSNTIAINVNNKIALTAAFFNQDLGTIYLLDNWIKEIRDNNIENFLVIIGAITEFIGNANPKWEWFADIWAGVVSLNLLAISFNTTEMTIDCDKLQDLSFASFFTGQITFKYKTAPDNRKDIKTTFPNLDLTTANLDENPSQDEIKTALLQLNPDLKNKYDENEIKRYLQVDDIQNRTAKISWAPGSKSFLGHHWIIWGFIGQEDYLAAINW